MPKSYLIICEESVYLSYLKSCCDDSWRWEWASLFRGCHFSKTTTHRLPAPGTQLPPPATRIPHRVSFLVRRIRFPVSCVCCLPSPVFRLPFPVSRHSSPVSTLSSPRIAWHLPYRLAPMASTDTSSCRLACRGHVAPEAHSSFVHDAVYSVFRLQCSPFRWPLTKGGPSEMAPNMKRRWPLSESVAVSPRKLLFS